MTATSRELDLDGLLLIAQGHAAFQLLWAGVQLDVFSLLSRQPGLSLEAIAGQLGLQTQPARILLVGLTALGLVRKAGDAYSNSGIAEKMLVSGSPINLGPVLGWQAHIVYPGLRDLLESLQQYRNVGLRHFPGEGETLYERLVSHPAIERVFQDAMSGLSRQANANLLTAVDLAPYRHLVDMGGGDGTNAIATARRFPHLRVTVFDSPSVCELARANIRQAGLEGRVDTCPGELFRDPFPAGADVFLFSHMFTIWSLEKNRALLQKSHAALPTGGSVLIFNMMGHDDDSGPLGTALGSPYFLAIATGEGMLYSWSDHEAQLRGAGFARIERVQGLPFNHGLLIGTK